MDELEKVNQKSTNHTIAITLIALTIIDPLIHYLLIKYFVVNNDIFLLSGWMWKFSLYITLLIERINWDLGIFLLIPTFIIVSIYIIFKIGSFLEKKFPLRKQRNFITVLLIVLFIIYYTGGAIYLIITSNPEYSRISIDSGYELIVGPIVNDGSNLNLSFKVLNKANKRQDVVDIDIKVLKDHKEFLPLKEEIMTDYSRTFKAITPPLKVHIGEVKLANKEESITVLNVNRYIKIRQIYTLK